MLTDVQKTLLQLLRCSLFDGEKPDISDIDLVALLQEAKAQSVFPLVYSTFTDEMKQHIPDKAKCDFENDYFAELVNNVRIFSEHDELHELMTKAGIPYVILKGCASAMYYPEPELRSMGDVDFLVYEKDIPRGIKTLEDNGFHRDQYEFTTNQSAYLRPPMTTWEIHKEPSGIPKNEIGVLIRKELSSLIEKRELQINDDTKYYVPDKYHHGIVLLLHKISHMTSTGIGLRHFCDWAVFESKLTDDEFKSLFQDELMAFGIWKFVQIITMLCERYLGAPKRKWAQNRTVSLQQLDEIMMDILSGGNFGKKDANRIREIKYLTDRKEGMLGDKGIFSQALFSLNSKVYIEHPAIRRHKAFLPVGWMIEGGKYFGMLITGKRKRNNTSAMLKEATRRKKIYKNMRLFQVK